MFGKKKIKKTYDRERQKPIIRCSICNGEQVAGFRDLQTGAFEEIMLIRDADDLGEFMSMYGVEREDITKEY